MYQVDSAKLQSIARKYNLDLIVVFGSQAKGRAVPGQSDIDVAVRFVKRPWGHGERELDLMAELAQAFKGNGEVDVAFLNGASPLLLYQVAATGQLVYEKRSGLFSMFRVYAARRYDDNHKFFVQRERYMKERYG